MVISKDERRERDTININLLSSLNVLRTQHALGEAEINNDKYNLEKVYRCHEIAYFPPGGGLTQYAAL